MSMPGAMCRWRSSCWRARCAGLSSRPWQRNHDSKLIKRRNPAVSPARLERYIAEYKRLCVRVLGVYPLHLEPEGIDLKAQPVPDGTSVVVPRLEVHSMVVGELED